MKFDYALAELRLLATVRDRRRAGNGARRLAFVPHHLSAPSDPGVNRTEALVPSVREVATEIAPAPRVAAVAQMHAT